jgi:predicted TIM-barrel fold metal-dependent hydrolase
MMQIIDAHIHADFDSRWLQRIGYHCGVEFSADGLKKEMGECGVVQCVSMGLRSLDLGMDSNAPTPYETAENLRLPDITYIGGINPFRADPPSLEKTRTGICNGFLRGLKVYLGYFPFPPHAPVYKPFYRLAEECTVPVIFHTGGTESSDRKLNCAHPSGIDEIATDYQGVNFLIAHLGNPWFMDAAEVVAENENVYADLSGFVAGADVDTFASSYQLTRLREALEWLGNSSRLLYGSDWPLTPMKGYIEFICRLFPYRNDREKVFYKNALRFFKLQLP